MSAMSAAGKAVLPGRDHAPHGVCLAGQQRFNFLLLCQITQFSQRGFTLVDTVLVVFRLAQFDQSHSIFELLLEATVYINPLLKRLPIAHHTLCNRGIIP